MAPEQAEQLVLAPERLVHKIDRPISERGDAEVFLAPKRVLMPDGTSYQEGKRPAEPDSAFDQQASISADDGAALPKARAAEPKSLGRPAKRLGAASLVDFSPPSKEQTPSLSVNPGAVGSVKSQHGVVDINTWRPPSFNTVIPSLARQTERISRKTSPPVSPAPPGPAVGVGETATQTAKTSLPPLRRRDTAYARLSLLAGGLQRQKKAAAKHLSTAFLLSPSRIIGRSLIHGRRLAVQAGTQFLQVRRQTALALVQTALALENGIRHVDRRLLVASRQVSTSTKQAVSAALRAQSKAKDVTSRLLTSAKSRAISYSKRARPQATAEQDRDRAAKLAQRSKVFEWMHLSERGAMAKRAQTIRAAGNDVIEQVKAASALRCLAKPSMAFSLSDMLEKAGFPKISRSHYWVLSGVAVASITILFAIMAPNRTAPSDDPARVLPLPSQVSEAPKEEFSTLLPIDDPFVEVTADASVSWPAESGTESAAGVLKWLKANEGLSQFTKAAEVVGLKNLLETGGPYTIFIPDDSAFTKLAPGEFDRLLAPAEHARLLNLLVNHIVDERLTLFDIAGRIQEVTSLAGQQVTIDATNIIRVGEAGVIDTDFLVGDFVVHVIDSVLDVANP